MLSCLHKPFQGVSFSGLSLVVAGTTLSIITTSPSKAATLKWSFQLNYSNGSSASGFFLTPGNAFTPDQTYTITGIEGSQSGVSITGLSPRRVAVESQTPENTPSNSFFWNSSNTVQSTSQGIAFNLNGNDPNDGGAIMLVEAYGAAPGVFSEVNGWKYSFGTTDSGTTFSNTPGGVSSTSLTPDSIIPDPQPVPGPLPILGAAAAFGWSRRMRHKLTVAKGPRH
jgi:hypothetical protein